MEREINLGNKDGIIEQEEWISILLKIIEKAKEKYEYATDSG